MSSMSGSRWAATAPGGGDVAYRMQSLTYKPIELGLDEGVPLLTLVRLFVWAFLASLAVSVFFGVLFLIAYLASDPNPFTGQTPGGSILIVGYVLSFIAFWVVLLGARIDEPIAEWKTLLEDKFAAADSAYAAIYGSFGRHSTPVSAGAVRVRSDLLAPETVNNRLMITERSYTVYVSVFPYGTSLYIGWTMWRSRRGAVVLGHYVKDLVGGLVGRAGSINQMLRTERVRAMREAVHAAVREGAEVAMQGVEVPIATTFGYDLPVQDLRGGQPDRPGPAPVPAGPPSFPTGPSSFTPGPPPSTPGPSSFTPSPSPFAPAPSSFAPAPSSFAPAPSSFAPDPAPAQPGPAPAQPGPAPTQPGPAPAQPGPAPTQPDPAPSQPGPAMAQPDPAPAQPGPAAAQPDPAAAKAGPAPTQPHPAPATSAPPAGEDADT